MKEKYCTSLQISIKFVPEGTTDNKSILVQVIIMVGHWTGRKPLPEPMTTKFIDAYINHEACKHQGAVSLPLMSSPNEFSWHLIFTDGISTLI